MAAKAATAATAVTAAAARADSPLGFSGPAPHPRGTAQALLSPRRSRGSPAVRSARAAPARAPRAKRASRLRSCSFSEERSAPTLIASHIQGEGDVGRNVVALFRASDASGTTTAFAEFTPDLWRLGLALFIAVADSSQ